MKQLFMHSESGFEDLVLKNTTQAALQRFADSLDWPPHLKSKYPDLAKNTAAALADYFAWSKGNWGLADYLSQCSEGKIPAWLRQVCTALKTSCSPPPVPSATAPQGTGA